ADTSVLVLSQYIEDQYAIELIGEGHERVGYLLKERITDVEALLDAVQRVAGGGSVIDPQVVSQLLRRHRAEDPLELLSPRECEVLELMAEGRSNHAIAAKLVVSERAVEKHVTSIFSKLDLPPAEDDHRGAPRRGARSPHLPAGLRGTSHGPGEPRRRAAWQQARSPASGRTAGAPPSPSRPCCSRSWWSRSASVGSPRTARAPPPTPTPG